MFISTAPVVSCSLIHPTIFQSKLGCPSIALGATRCIPRRRSRPDIRRSSISSMATTRFCMVTPTSRGYNQLGHRAREQVDDKPSDAQNLPRIRAKYHECSTTFTALLQGIIVSSWHTKFKPFHLLERISASTWSGVKAHYGEAWIEVE